MCIGLLWEPRPAGALSMPRLHPVQPKAPAVKAPPMATIGEEPVEVEDETRGAQQALPSAAQALFPTKQEADDIEARWKNPRSREMRALTE